MQSHRASKKITIDTDDVDDQFDVVPSPDLVNQEMEDAKGSILEIKNDRLNLVEEEDYFDTRRDVKSGGRATIKSSKDWEAAGDDSEEEWQPLGSIVPDHLKSEDE